MISYHRESLGLGFEERVKGCVKREKLELGKRRKPGYYIVVG